ncbi:hypothetical protein LTR84_009615 [Exophiala bonariae]|uniref:Uncharacterized protein n=1 Tax=Exophiala bonariae TaxID=1690606 RepID=A0AAV9NIT8_9EURO|nr:hypothetical protein LTR84_009615 [Exophiala bonariae]
MAQLGRRNIDSGRQPTIPYDILHRLPPNAVKIRPSHTSISKVSSYEYTQNWTALSSTHSIFDGGLRWQRSTFEARLTNLNPECSTWVLLVEDISSQLAKTLQSSLNVDPQFFAEHLINSSWVPSGRTDHQQIEDPPTPYTDAEASTWWTKRFQKCHASIKWYRPYTLRLIRGSMRLSRRQYRFHRETSTDDESESESETSAQETQLDMMAICNSRRRHLDLRLENGEWDYETSTSERLQNGDKLAVEERVSLWKGTLGSREIGIWTFLLVGNTAEKVHFQAPGMPAIETRPLPLTLFVESESAAQGKKGSRRHSYGSFPRNNGPQCLPKHNQITPGAGIDNSQDSVPQNTHTPAASEIAVDQLGAPHSMGQCDESQRNGSVHFSPPSDIGRRRLPFQNCASRGPASDYQIFDPCPQGLVAQLSTTLEDLALWLEREAQPSLTKSYALGPMSAVFFIIHCDTMDFLQLVESFIDNVHSLAEDELTLQRNIAIWRRLVNILGAELRALTKSIPPFTAFLCGPTNDKGKTSDQHSIKDASENLLEEILRVQKRLDKLFHVLVSSLSIVESRRGIAEAESVTKLTELGKLTCPQN